MPAASANTPLCFNSLSLLAGARAGFLLDLFSLLAALLTDIPLLSGSLDV